MKEVIAEVKRLAELHNYHRELMLSYGHGIRQLLLTMLVHNPRMFIDMRGSRKQRAIAHITGVPQPYVCAFERGDIGKLSNEHIIKLLENYYGGTVQGASESRGKVGDEVPA